MLGNEKRQAVVAREDEAAWIFERDFVSAQHGAMRWQNLFSGEKTPTQALTFGVAELPPETQLIRHWHEQPESYYFLEGVGVVGVDDAEYAVETGTAVFIPGRAWHFIKNTGDAVLRLVYTFPTDTFDEIEYHYEAEEH
jgi:mannose-6-phosphate isomerase-like protein (cupin superfamily)